jgi:CheY-like chemotaxis protein
MTLLILLSDNFVGGNDPLGGFGFGVGLRERLLSDRSCTLSFGMSDTFRHPPRRGRNRPVLAMELHPHDAGLAAHMRKTDMSVLVVEDEKLVSWSLENSLSKWGFNVQSVCTGNDAVARLKESGFDIVLLDYQLPDLDGLSVARQVRRIRPGAVIFLVTAFQLNELSVDDGLIDDYFNKPLDLQQLHRALDQIPGGKHGTR